MANELYFLPILLQALQSSQPKESLLQAFQRIQTLGQHPEYREGFRQFQQFMNEVKKSASGNAKSKPSNDSIHIDELAFDSDDRKELELWLAEMEDIPELPSGFEIGLEKNGRSFKNACLSKSQRCVSIGNLQPGLYTLKLTTGWALWEGELTAEDLLWTAAFPGQALALAADTEAKPGDPSREFLLLEGEIVIKIFPGIESGSMEISWQELEKS